MIFMIYAGISLVCLIITAILTYKEGKITRAEIVVIE